MTPRSRRRATLVGVWVGLLGCAGGEPPQAAVAQAPSTTEDAAGWTPAERATLRGMSRLDRLPPDPTNAKADDADAAALGRALFFDAGLSASGTVSCASCHDPAKHFTDGRAKAVGIGTTARHAPGIEGSQLGPWFFWDGRADSLWAQAAGPLESPVEMGATRAGIAHRVAAVHRAAWEPVWGPLPDLAGVPPQAGPASPGAAPTASTDAWERLSPSSQQALTRVLVQATKAIAAYERTLLPGVSAFDRYVDALEGGDATGGGALDADALAGLRLFVRDGNCVACHSGPFFTDRAFHNLGLPNVGAYDPGRTVGARAVAESEFNCKSAWSDTADCPELRYLNPAFDDFVLAFKTPSLRNVAETAPYMHDGSLSTLDDVLAFYNALPGQPALGHRELTLRPLAWSEAQRASMKAFLSSLTSPPVGASPLDANPPPPR